MTEERRRKWRAELPIIVAPPPPASPPGATATEGAGVVAGPVPELGETGTGYGWFEAERDLKRKNSCYIFLCIVYQVNLILGYSPQKDPSHGNKLVPMETISELRY